MAFFNQKGHSVTGVDRDPFALASAQAYGRTVLADIENTPWPFSHEVFDAVVVTNYLWRPVFPAILSALKPGAILIYETFSHGNETVGRPARPQFLLQRGELLRVCDGFEVIAYENGYLQAPERFVQRICAVKPNPQSGATLQKQPLLSLECRDTSI
jgi:SAM-dependent methyltransferase